MASFKNPKAPHESDLVGEPTLDELLTDPMVKLLMKRDGVKPQYMRGEIDRLQRELSLA